MDKQLRPVLVAYAILFALIGNRIIIVQEVADSPGIFSLIFPFIRTYWLQMDIIIVSILLFDALRNEHSWGYRGHPPYYRDSTPHEVWQVGESQEPESAEVEAPESSEPLQVMECPKCAGPLEFEEGNELTKCAHCGVQVKRRVD